MTIEKVGYLSRALPVAVSSPAEYFQGGSGPTDAAATLPGDLSLGVTQFSGVAFGTGPYLRSEELAVLDREDVDIAHGVVNIHRASDLRTGEIKPTKTKRPRKVNP